MSQNLTLSIPGGILIVMGLLIVFFGLFISERHPSPDVSIVGRNWAVATPGLALVILSFARRQVRA